MVPEFAVIGHPNEGKSSVVSTLAEDDTVRISPYPGETVVCRTYPVMIDGREVIRFTDTPGFQAPRKTLDWFQAYDGAPDAAVTAFIQAHKDDDLFRDEIELMAPLKKGAGIIYVADASRPLRKVDTYEMEILRLTGLPRMAIINAKSSEYDYTDQWKAEFRKHFNAIRIFNAHNATYSERILLLESLKHIDQEWQPALDMVISAFKQDWDKRNAFVADVVLNLLSDVVSHEVSLPYKTDREKKETRKKLEEKYVKGLDAIEKKAHRTIRGLFKHNIFDIELPADSVVRQTIADQSTWQVLGLTRKQVVTAAAAIGGSAGALLDVTVLGHSLGMFALLGGAILGGSAYFGGEKIMKTRVKGMRLGKYRMSIGPADSIQLMMVYLDRAFIYYTHVINWAHGRRDHHGVKERAVTPKSSKIGMTSQLDPKDIRLLTQFFTMIVKSRTDLGDEVKKKLTTAIKSWLTRVTETQSSSETLLS